MTALGIDFGTTNSVVARWANNEAEVLEIDNPAEAAWEGLGLERVMPSVFAKAPDDSALFGWAAKRTETGRFEAVKRLFATQQDHITDDTGTVFAVEEMATFLFSELKAAAARQGIDATQAVITVPANSRGLARHRTKICAGMAGLQVLALINEPTAAAMAYSARNPGDQQILVFDWGGGTLDVTVLQSVEGVFMEEVSKGLPTKGGLDFDSRMRKLLLETVPDTTSWTAEEKRRFEMDTELAKIKLSTQDFVEIQLPGGDSRRVTRAMFQDAVRPLVEEAARPIQQCLTDLRAGPGAVDAVVMVGGTSNIPLVRQHVAELLGREPEVGIDPMTAVGEGAAIAAAIMTGDLDTSFHVATEHALGTVAVDPRFGQIRFSPVIPRNHKLPASRTERFVPLSSEQETADIRVIEGDPDEPLDHPDNVILKEWRVPIPGVGNDGRSLEMTYNYDVDGILNVTVTDGTTGEVVLEDDVAFGVTDDKRELVRIARQARDLRESGKVEDQPGGDAVQADPEAVQLLQQAQVKVIPFLDGTEADEVREAAGAVENADPDDLEAAKGRLRDALSPYSYLF